MESSKRTNKWKGLKSLLIAANDGHNVLNPGKFNVVCQDKGEFVITLFREAESVADSFDFLTGHRIRKDTRWSFASREYPGNPNTFPGTERSRGMLTFRKWAPILDATIGEVSGVVVNIIAHVIHKSTKSHLKNLIDREGYFPDFGETNSVSWCHISHAWRISNLRRIWSAKLSSPSLHLITDITFFGIGDILHPQWTMTFLL